MVFSSLLFIFLFLPLTLVGNCLLKDRYRNAFLLFASLLFYAYGEQNFVVVLIGSICINYILALLIQKNRANQSVARLLLCLAVTLNVGLLFVFKYLNFVTESLSSILGGQIKTDIALPIGISFFTFQALSYVIDVYRDEDIKAEVNPISVGLYISFFPQLVAGPIVRYDLFINQIHHRSVSLELFATGIKRFTIGLGKKVIIANAMAIIADAAFASDVHSISVAFAWLGALSYTLQIYYDFSGYSDMAIGLGKMFGFEFLENFNYPYISRSITEFWRRWHISLGTWFRDYVYIPLGGSKVHRVGRQVYNLLIVWLLTGLWHGASWNFVAWGLTYFLLILVERFFVKPSLISSRLAAGGWQFLSLLFIVLGWVLFRAPGLREAADYMMSMIGACGNSLVDNDAVFYLYEYKVLIPIAVVLCTPLPKIVISRMKRLFAKLSYATSIITVTLYTLLLLGSVSYLVMGAHNPFIYFNF